MKSLIKWHAQPSSNLLYHNHIPIHVILSFQHFKQSTCIHGIWFEDNVPAYVSFWANRHAIFAKCTSFVAILQPLGWHNYISWTTVPSYGIKASIQKIKYAFSNCIIFPQWKSVCRLYTFITRQKMKWSKTDLFSYFDPHPMVKTCGNMSVIQVN